MIGAMNVSSNQDDMLVCLLNPVGGYVWKSLTSSRGVVPAGTVAFFVLHACPQGWAEANGQPRSIGMAAMASVDGPTFPICAGEFLASGIAGRGLIKPPFSGAVQKQKRKGAFSPPIRSQGPRIFPLDANSDPQWTSSVLLTGDSSLPAPMRKKRSPKFVLSA
jgi:hypothetical protein